MIGRFCRKIAGFYMLICFLVCCGVVGKIEHGGSLSLAWIAFGALGSLGLVLYGASRGENHD
jgi:hypothetical protein